MSDAAPSAVTEPSKESPATLPAVPAYTDGSARYINRELSWLEFNQRVLDEAWEASNPLLERLKFLCIVSSNLDEFFEVRVAGLKQQHETSSSKPGPDGMNAAEQLDAVAVRVRKMVDDQYRCWREQLAPGMAAEGIRFLKFHELDEASLAHFERYFEEEVYPILTPLAIDPSHPFPTILNKSLNVAVEFANKDLQAQYALVQVPRILPRVLRVPDRGSSYDFVFIGDLIKHHAAKIVSGVEIAGAHLFRVTRNSNLYYDEEETNNLLSAIEEELRRRNRGKAVRLELHDDCPTHIQEVLLRTFELEPQDLYAIHGPINFRRLMPLLGEIDRPDLKDEPFTPAPVLPPEADLFANIRKGDILVHHPYDSFRPVVDFIERAAADPNVLAIKQTLYRTSGDSPFVKAMIRAAREGKQVAAVVELKARFDEEANIRWARMLEEAGVTVVYGLLGYKTHCKAALVVRREEGAIRRYVHLGTGNYHPSTAKLYTDLGLFTCDEKIGEDVTELFNALTGLAQLQSSHKMLFSPFNFHSRMLEMVRRETANAKAGKKGAIYAKMNSLLEPQLIDALYEASQAGVEVRLLVRGICALRANVPGLSENIQVRSLVGRFLEHSRIYYFENGGNPDVFIASADWMQRNCFHRYETCTPIGDPALREKVAGILEDGWKDNVKSTQLQASGTYTRVRDGKEPFDAQEHFLRLAREAAGSW